VKIWTLGRVVLMRECLLCRHINQCDWELQDSVYASTSGGLVPASQNAGEGACRFRAEVWVSRWKI
jgi:hypothetical protein